MHAMIIFKDPFKLCEFPGLQGKGGRGKRNRETDVSSGNFGEDPRPAGWAIKCPLPRSDRFTPSSRVWVIEYTGTSR